MSAVHIHLSLNHVPVLGVIFGIVFLVVGLLRKNPTLYRAGLMTLVVSAAFAVPVYLTGEPAEEVVERIPGVMESQIKRHENLAKIAFALVMMLGVLSAGALVWWRRQPEMPTPLLAALLVLGLLAAGTIVYAANQGGLIRHPEIVSAAGGTSVPGAVPAPTPDRERGEHERHEGEGH